MARSAHHAAGTLLTAAVLMCAACPGAAYIDGGVDGCRSPLEDELAAQLSILPGETAPGDLGWGERSSSDWGENFNYSAKLVYFPKTVSRLQEIVNKSCSVRVLGSRQAINRIADTPHTLVSLEELKHTSMGEMGLVAQGGATYSDVMGIAMEVESLPTNVPSHPYITIAGAVSTGSHGSGASNGILATSVQELTVITPDGELETIERDHPDFNGAVVSLGALGPIVEIKLETERLFAVGSCVYVGLALEELMGSWDDILTPYFSISLYTNWDGRHFSSVWTRQKLPAIHEGSGRRRTHCPNQLYGSRLLTHDGVHPIARYPPHGVVRTAKRQDLANLGTYTYPPGIEVGARWSEYFVPMELGVHAVADLFDELLDELRGVALVSELRVVAADELWLSPCFGRPCAAISFQWNNSMAAEVDVVLPKVEALLLRYEAAPHWGGLFHMPPEVLQALPVYLDVIPHVREMLKRRDPGGKFRNDFVERYIMRDAIGGEGVTREEL